MHYRPTRRTNRRIAPGELFLVDSGAQYVDGTTDITRTVAFGAPIAEHAGPLHPRAARATSPWRPRASRRAPPAWRWTPWRGAPLWEAGLDYDHGTGHGVGSYLSVHEGPQRIAKASSPQALLPGMIVSNEPGYYKTGAYGIRIENLIVVTPPAAVAGGEREMLGFETLTLRAHRPHADRRRPAHPRRARLARRLPRAGRGHGRAGAGTGGARLA